MKMFTRQGSKQRRQSRKLPSGGPARGRKRKTSNDLKNHHPNLVAVNYLLSTDYQVANSLSESVQSLTLLEIEPNIDVLAASAIGIDERLSREKLEVIEVSRSHVNCEHLNKIADLSGSGT